MSKNLPPGITNKPRICWVCDKPTKDAIPLTFINESGEEYKRNVCDSCDADKLTQCTICLRHVYLSEQDCEDHLDFVCWNCKEIA